MKTKAVFHIDWEKRENLVMALNNIKNLFKAVPVEDAVVHVVANGPAVNLFKKDGSQETAWDIQALSEQGVLFLLCSNSLNNFGLSPDDLIGCCKTIPAGVVELIRLQNEGFAYIKP